MISFLRLCWVGEEKGEGKGRGHVLICNSGLTDFGQAGHKYPECNDIRVLDVFPFERDNGKALRLAAIYRASRASLSQCGWESHQPQEEPHSRYLPHLQATQQNPASPSRRNPASSEVGGGEVLVPSQRCDRRLRTAGLRCVQQAWERVLCRHRRHGCTGLLRCRFTRGGQGGVRGSVHRQMLRSRDLLLARTCLYQAVPERPEAELSCRSRGGCSAETAMP